MKALSPAVDAVRPDLSPMWGNMKRGSPQTISAAGIDRSGTDAVLRESFVFHAADRATQTIAVYTPREASHLPVFICLPAMGLAASYYEPFGMELAASGAGTALLADLRGQGSSSEKARDGAVFGYRDILETDFAGLLEDVRHRYPGRPVYLVGHSLGGQLATLFAARKWPELAGLVLVAAGTAHPAAWSGIAYLKAWVLTSWVRLVAALLPWYPGPRAGFGGEHPKLQMRDWSHVVKTGLYQPIGSSFDYEAACRTAALPVLALNIVDDPVTPQAATEALLNRLECASITRWPVRGVSTDRPWKRHFSWARAPKEIAGAIDAWVAALEKSLAIRRG